MVVVYYTSTAFMDVMLETIQGIQEKVQLHVLIEISPVSKKSTIIDVESLEGLSILEKPEKVLGESQWSYLKPYFKQVASVHFVVHQHPKSFSFSSMRTAYQLGGWLQKLRADVFQFDGMSPRTLGLYPFLRKQKLVISLHDPVPHSGEQSWKTKVPEKLYYPLAKSFIFYSRFAAGLFKESYSPYRVPQYTIRLLPYTCNRRFLKQPEKHGKYILFFGRLSFYKGIDILLKAIPKVLEAFPDQQFIVAGKPVFGYQVDAALQEACGKNLIIKDSFIPTGELVSLIENAAFIVCPYRDATQSGVLMTSFALNKPVIASDVGSFPEYIHDDVNGALCKADPASLSETIIRALKNDHYLMWYQGVQSAATKDDQAGNANQLLLAYGVKND